MVCPERDAGTPCVVIDGKGRCNPDEFGCEKVQYEIKV